ncbi:ATP-binding cassette subfamily B protein [Streptomyces sp. Amel2xB2]|uniref:ABC transporter ATP-binding protein n=1 Tax=Streptomyces sp. Amel2xB2 TaxID=1305829 RepID=UPI000DBA5914|nr:ABC transporter ATP-binding protein [Streptomyces sp. Amel2xB2]RAJ67161.1 ATP-binding cassette subfamily B protein [Streptomyces sp. Amel2xB2]
MIRLLLGILGEEHSGALRRTVALMVARSAAEGLSYALLVPLLRALLADDPARAWLPLGAFAVCVAVTGVLSHLSAVSGFRCGGELSRALHHRLGDRLALLPLGWFTPARVGEVSGLTSRSVMAAMSVPAHRLQPLISAVVVPLSVVAVLFVFEWRLALAALAAVPLVWAAHRWTGRSAAAEDKEQAERSDEVSGRVVEYVRAQPVLRAGNRSGERFRLLDDALTARWRSDRRAALAGVPALLGMSFTVRAAFTAVLALAGALALDGRIGGAETVALLILAARCVDPLLSLAELGAVMRSSRGELTRIQAVLSEPPLPVSGESAVPEGNAVALTDVTFRRGDRTVLDGVSLSVPEGGRLALVGPSGAGKSTVLELVARFHDVDEGTVRIGGADVRDMDEDTLMSRIAVVFQDVYLFTGTIEENVRLARHDASAEQLREAAAAARLDEVVARLPHGWKTQVGEGGTALSGGERQRVSLARALLKDAPVLLLDEATSALDPRNEAGVQEGLEALVRGRTVIMVAHRLHTVRQADTIAFLDEHGRVAEWGGHDELLARDARYAEFWRIATSGAA